MLTEDELGEWIDMRGPPQVDFDERESVPQPFLQYPRARDGIVFIALLTSWLSRAADRRKE